MDARRCTWAKGPEMIDYHDREWGVPLHDDRALFEFLILEGAQAGLSWETVLKKRDAYRKAFAGFAPERVARLGARDVERLLKNPGIIRNRLKVASAIKNAQLFLDIAREHGSFDAYLWSFVGGKPLQKERRMPSDVPAQTPESDRLSKDLKKRGFNFVGSTIMYAYMQAVGLTNDHLKSCFRYKELRGR